MQIPDRFFREEMAEQGITLPPVGEYGVGHIFMPRDEKQIEHFKKVIKDVITEEGQVFIGFRDVPVDNSSLSKALKPLPQPSRTMCRSSSALKRGCRKQRRVRASAVHAAQGHLQPHL